MKIRKRLIRGENESGQAMLEFALILPILMLLVCGIIDFGWLFFNQLSLDNLCREGARYAVVNVTEDDPQELVGSRIDDMTPGIFADGVEAELVFTNPMFPTRGDVRVTLTADMTILTPVLSTISGGVRTRTLTSTVVMKAES